jgi:arylsulfatase A-like enzyme
MPSTLGGTVDATVSNADVAPTLAALAGLDAIPGVDGRSLLALLTSGPPPPDLVDRSIPLGWAGSDEVPGWVGVRTADAVAIRWADGFEEVYDLQTDPAELHNLIGTGPGDRLWTRLAPRLPPSLAPVEGGG